MKFILLFLNGLVFAQHVLFFYLEAFLWKTETGRKIFRMNEAAAAQTYPLAINQGFYNLFFAFGFLLCLILELTLDSHPETRKLLTVMNLYLSLSIVCAAAVGGWTVSKRILFIQGLPSGLLSLLLIYNLYFSV